VCQIWGAREQKFIESIQNIYVPQSKNNLYGYFGGLWQISFVYHNCLKELFSIGVEFFNINEQRYDKSIQYDEKL
jgi:hypothetical protein